MCSQNPWILFQLLGSVLVFVSGGHFIPAVNMMNSVATDHPQLVLLVRKIANALPAVLSGVLARKTAASGAMMILAGLTVPTLLLMSLLVVMSSLTEYLVVDCVFLMVAG